MENNKEAISPRANQSTTAAAGTSLDESLKKLSLWRKLVRTVPWIIHLLEFGRCSVPAISNHSRIRDAHCFKGYRKIGPILV